MILRKSDEAMASSVSVVAIRLCIYAVHYFRVSHGLLFRRVSVLQE